MDFFQTPPELKNQFESDRMLTSYLEHHLGAEVFQKVTPDLSKLGDRAIYELLILSQEAENEPPVHIPYGPWGKRIDEVRVSKAWKRLDEISCEEGLIRLGYTRPYGDLSRLYQLAKLYLFHPSSAIYSCPLAMTDGAARVIELHGDEALKNKAFKHLTSDDPKTFWTSGQWMTERTGGSDVSGTSTVAKKENGKYRLYGVKWFTSATTSQMAMTLARIEGEEKLSLFYVELRDESGELQNIQINRLKEKMGTRALPTAELTLSGTPATLVGESGKGVKTIATLFNVTRVYNAVCAVGYMRRGLALAIDYAHKRQAFGKRLIDHGLHAETLSDLQVRFEASFLLTFHAAKLLGREECKTGTAEESSVLRLLIPLAKLFTAKEGVHISSEVLESFGGAGYIEDTGIPQISRNAQVLAIWEGTTNVLSLDALRAIKKENSGEAILKDMMERLSLIKHPSLLGSKEQLITSIKSLTKILMDAMTYSEEDLSTGARELALSLSRTYAGSLMIEEAQWNLENKKDQRLSLSLSRWIEKGLVRVSPSGQERRMESLSLLT